MYLYVMYLVTYTPALKPIEPLQKTVPPFVFAPLSLPTFHDAVVTTTFGVSWNKDLMVAMHGIHGE